MVGAYRAAAKASKPCLQKAIGEHNAASKKALVDMFTEKFFLHGYPMDAALLRKNKIEVSEIDDDEESMIYELLDHYIKAAMAGDDRKGPTIIHSDVGHTVIRGDTGAVRTIYDEKGQSRKGALLGRPPWRKAGHCGWRKPSCMRSVASACPPQHRPVPEGCGGGSDSGRAGGRLAAELGRQPGSHLP